MSNQESITSLRAALEALHNPAVYNQAWVDCSNLLNLSKESLEQHFLSWLWVDEGTPAYEGTDLAYAVKLGEIEESLIIQGFLYEDCIPTK
jgi:hypothetical protein